MIQYMYTCRLFRFGLVKLQDGWKARRRVDNRSGCGTVPRRGVDCQICITVVVRINKSLRAYGKYRQSSETYRAHQKDGSDTRQQRVNEKNGRWKRRDFNNPAADCRKRADTQSDADSGMPADIPAELDLVQHSLLAEPVPI